MRKKSLLSLFLVLAMANHCLAEAAAKDENENESKEESQNINDSDVPPPTGRDYWIPGVLLLSIGIPIGGILVLAGELCQTCEKQDAEMTIGTGAAIMVGSLVGGITLKRMGNPDRKAWKEWKKRKKMEKRELKKNESENGVNLNLSPTLEGGLALNLTVRF